jgi:transposase InsO family protein
MLTDSQLMYERYRLFCLMQAQPHWSLRAYARELQHDLKWVRVWVARLKPFLVQTDVSLDTFASHSRRPKRIPRRIPPPIQERICVLRQTLSERFHRRAGAETIHAFLREEMPASATVPCPRTIHTILKQRGVIVSPSRPAPHPLVLPPPMEEWEMDFGQIYLGPDEGVFEFFLVVDRGTSRVIYLEGSRGYTAETALEAVARLLRQAGRPSRLRFDRDPRLWGSWTRDSYPSALLCFLRCLGIEDIICPPHRPDLKPVVERTIQTLKYEWLARHSPRTVADALELLTPFVRYYNSERPHQGHACQNQTPDAAFPVLPICPALPQRVQADAWLPSIHERVYRQRVNSNGAIHVDRHSYYVGETWAGQPVLVQVDVPKEVFHIRCDDETVKTVPMKGLVTQELPFEAYPDVMKQEARTVEMHRAFTWQQTGAPF